MEKKKKKKKNRSKSNAKKLALQKIENNIENIYEDVKIKKKMFEARRAFRIKNNPDGDNLFNDYKNVVSSMEDIYELINFLMQKWIMPILKNKQDMEAVNKSVAEFNIEMEINDNNEASKVIKAISKKTIGGRYLIDVSTIFRNGGTMFYRDININPQIWKSIIFAMLFTVPKEEVLKRKISISEDYFPSINNSLQIQINELTTLSDFRIIKKKIKDKQKKNERQNKSINVKRKHTKRKTDKTIEDYYNQGFRGTELKHKLKAEGIEEYTGSKTAERRRERKKYTRQN